MWETWSKVFSNFWVCLGMALLGLLALWGAILDGATTWIWIDVFCIVYWTRAAYKTTKQTIGDTPLTADQTRRIRVVTRRFVKEKEEIINEVRDESDGGTDKEADKKQSSDE